MAKAVRFYRIGGPEVLRYESVAVGDPGPGEVRLRHEAVGLNFADTYFRNGTYPVPLPNGIGGQLEFFFRLLRPGSVVAWTLCFTVVMTLVGIFLFRPAEKRVFAWRKEAIF